MHLLPTVLHQLGISFLLPMPGSQEGAVVLFICRRIFLPEESMSAVFTAHSIITTLCAAHFLRAKDRVHGGVLLHQNKRLKAQIFTSSSNSSILLHSSLVELLPPLCGSWTTGGKERRDLINVINKWCKMRQNEDLEVILARVIKGN